MREADPDNTLAEAERIRRADCIRHAYFKRLAAASVEARRGKAASRRGRQAATEGPSAPAAR